MDEQHRMITPAAADPVKVYSPAHKHKKEMPGKSWLRWVMLGIFVIVVGLIVWGLSAWNMNMRSESTAVNKSEYQAVFLTNGQVYFGKLIVVNPSYLKLSDIFYLQVQSSTSGTTSASQLSATNGSSTGGNVQLVKLGNELQGPEDMMAINREQVLFWENLKPAGKVTQAINKYQQ